MGRKTIAAIKRATLSAARAVPAHILPVSKMNGAAYTAAKKVKPVLVSSVTYFARGLALEAIRRIPKIIIGISATEKMARNINNPHTMRGDVKIIGIQP